MKPTSEELKRIRDDHAEWLMSLPGVSGTGIGSNRKSDEPEIHIFTGANGVSPEIQKAIEKRLHGVPFNFEPVGQIRAAPSGQ